MSQKRMNHLHLNVEKSKVKSLKLSWVKRLLSKTKASWKLIPMYIYQHCDLGFLFCL